MHQRGFLVNKSRLIVVSASFRAMQQIAELAWTWICKKTTC